MEFMGGNFGVCDWECQYELPEDRYYRMLEYKKEKPSENRTYETAKQIKSADKKKEGLSALV